MKTTIKKSVHEFQSVQISLEKSTQVNGGNSTSTTPDVVVVDIITL